MMQRAKGFASFQAAKALKDRQYWEKMKKRGHLLYLAQNIVMLIGLLALLDLIQLICSRLGWLHSTGSDPLLVDLFAAVLVGGCFGQASWYNMKRKLSLLQPDDDLTAK
jgi:hypothetical protein